MGGPWRRDGQKGQGFTTRHQAHGTLVSLPGGWVAGREGPGSPVCIVLCIVYVVLLAFPCRACRCGSGEMGDTHFSRPPPLKRPHLLKPDLLCCFLYTVPCRRYGSGEMVDSWMHWVTDECDRLVPGRQEQHTTAAAAAAVTPAAAAVVTPAAAAAVILNSTSGSPVGSSGRSPVAPTPSGSTA